MHYINLHRTDLDGITVNEQLVELRAVTLEFAAFVEDFAKHALHNCDVRADTDFSTNLFLNVGGCRKVIRMDVGFQNPLHLQIVGAYIGDNLISGLRIGVAVGEIEIQN